jgi:hypothetical protein
MNAQQEAKLQMYRAVENYCDANAAIIGTNAAFMAAFGDFKAKIAAIIITAQADDVPITGITADKNALKQALCGQAADLASIINAYAATVGNNTLRQQVDFSASALLKTREDLLAPRCQNIHDAGTANLAALADYGVTNQMLTALQTAIDAYAAATPKSRTAINERKTTTANLAAQFKETDGLLETRMDKIVVAFKTNDPDFVRTYEAARRLVKPPTTTTQLKGIVTDQADGKPIKGASITAAPDEPDITNPPITVTTDADGAYLIKPIIVGDYNITATATGFQNYEDTDVRAKLGDVNHFDIELVK